MIAFFFGGEGPRSKSYAHTAALKIIVQHCDEDEEKDDQFFSFFQVMEHRWNEIDRGEPKYSVKNLSQCHFVHHKSHVDMIKINIF
jgi:Zn-finger protein